MSKYANIGDLTSFGLPGAALTDIPVYDLELALEAASADIDSYLNSQYELPVSNWGHDITRACSILASYDIMCVRGFNPAGDDANIEKRADDVRKWLTLISQGRVSPLGLVDSSQTSKVGGPMVYTMPKRGW